MIVFCGVLFIVWFLLSALVIGEGVYYLFRDLPSSVKLPLGFACWFGLSELLGFPVMAKRGDRAIFLIIIAIVYFALMAIGIKSIIKNKTAIINSFFSSLKSYPLSAFITLILIVFVTVFYRSDADDSFYVSLAALFRESSLLNPYDPSFGYENLGTVPMYDFGIWECFLGSVGMLFNIEAVTLMHFFLPVVLLIVQAGAFLSLGEVLLEDKKRSEIFYLFVSILHLFGGYSVYSEGSFLLSRLWQGKAVYLTCVIPIMVCFILKSKLQKSLSLMVMGALIMLSGIGLNPTSLYVMGFLALFLSVGVAITDKTTKPFFFLGPLIAVVGAFTYFIYKRSLAFPEQVDASSKVTEDFVKETFLNFYGNGIIYLALFALSALIVILIGNIAAKTYIVLLPLFLMVFLYNPYMGGLVASYITKTPSYWRVFWIMPLIPGIAYAFTWLAFRVKTGFKMVSIVLVMAIIISLPGAFCDGFMFTKSNNFEVAENMERLPLDTIRFGELIGDDGVLLASDDLSTTVRQKYPRIKLIYSRYQYILDLFAYRGNKNEAAQRLFMYQFCADENANHDGIEGFLKSYDVDYVAIPKRNKRAIAKMKELGFSYIEGTDNLLYTLK